MRMAGPSGQIMHAELRIGDSVVMLGDENPQMGAVIPQSLGGTASGINVYIADLRLPTPKGGGFFGVTKQHGCSSPTMFPASRAHA
ncbi:MAG: hypothetical protein DMG30_25330 [Acidobacteria bacterium]|nr:MAG: hypothetical protein DMG30_25330 [Acidobacteriota bacterium]